MNFVVTQHVYHEIIWRELSPHQFEGARSEIQFSRFDGRRFVMQNIQSSDTQQKYEKIALHNPGGLTRTYSDRFGAKDMEPTKSRSTISQD